MGALATDRKIVEPETSSVKSFGDTTSTESTHINTPA